MQVYRELAILTARPSPAEMQLAPHRLYGTVRASEAYSAGRCLDDAARALADAEAQGSLPIFVGGTGLYFKALTEGLAAIPDIPPDNPQSLARQGRSVSAPRASMPSSRRAIPRWRRGSARPIRSASCARWK